MIRVAIGLAALTVLDADALPATIDLSMAPANIAVFGDVADGRAGFAVAAGDLNSDDADDLIIGAHTADSGEALADVNADGRIDAVDAALVLLLVAGLESEL